jgi:hypothetical protein
MRLGLKIEIEVENRVVLCDFTFKKRKERKIKFIESIYSMCYYCIHSRIES